MILTNVSTLLISVGVFALIGGVLGVLIGISAKIFHVEEDTRVEQVLALLPNANCGGCGFPGCSGMADAIVNNGANPAACKPIKADKEEAIKNLVAEFNKKEEK